MGRKWSNLNLPGALHYVTGNVSKRVPLFLEKHYCLEFLTILGEVSADWPAKIISYVVMPEHIHFIANPRDGDIKGFSGAVKSKFTLRVVHSTGDKFLLSTPKADGSIHELWQQSFKAIPLWSARMIWQKIHYIHSNPVKARLVKCAKDYPWSSYRAFYGEAQGILKVDKDWWWPDDSEKLSKAMKQLGWRSFDKRNDDE